MNFNKQQAAAARLTSELKNYLRCITGNIVMESFLMLLHQINEGN